MATPRENTSRLMRVQIRKMKAEGLSIIEIGKKLVISQALAHYYSKALPGEHICPRCCRKWEKAKKETK